MNTQIKQHRKIGVGGVFVTLVGLVIGISIYILPGSLAASAGPAVIVSYFIAALMALFSCVVAAQIGAIFPVNGASFIAISRLLSPFWGFIAIWFLVGAGAVAVGLLAYGFADYFNAIWPLADRKIIAFSIVVILGALNLSGTRETVLWQSIMVLSFMIALAIFGIFGTIHIDMQLLTPFMPNGWNAVWSAAVPAFFSYAGFMLIIEISGEIRDPARTIPVGLALSFVAVLVAYTVVSLSIVGVLPWSELANVTAPVGKAAHKIMPGWLATGITMTAIAAAASSINAVLLGYSRDIFAMAKVSLLPEKLSKLSNKSGEPVNSILLMALMSIITVIFGGRIADVATLVVIGLLSLQMLLGISLLFVRTKLPSHYENSSFKLKPWVLHFFALGLIGFSVMFLGIVIWGNMKIIIIASAYFSMGIFYYSMRIKFLRNKSIEIKTLIYNVINEIKPS